MYLVLLYCLWLCLLDLLIAVPGEVVMLPFSFPRIIRLGFILLISFKLLCVAGVCTDVKPSVGPSLISNTNVTSPIQDISTHGDTRYRQLLGGSAASHRGDVRKLTRKSLRSNVITASTIAYPG